MVGTALPNELGLDQNYPNPFNPSTTINYSLPESNVVSLIVYDLKGAVVAQLVNGYQSAGYHTVAFDASNLAAGTYITVLEVGGERFMNRMLLIK